MYIYMVEGGGEVEDQEGAAIKVDPEREGVGGEVRYYLLFHLSL